jgi:uncharacterized protein YdiU (UPF0061 family)
MFKQPYLQLNKKFYSKVEPTNVSNPEFVIVNNDLIQKLNLEEIDPNELLTYLSGNRIYTNSEPIAQAYCGHQFGYFNMLGDGRAILLGKINGLDVQLKGAGPTPYSRSGDGRATLGSMVREYIISEAMHAFGIPTTRSLAVVKTGDPVYRETTEDGAILTRISQEHVRVGTFQYALTKGEKYVRELVEYMLPKLQVTNVQELLKEVVRRQAKLMVDWQLIGFIHGVMNTDNMSIIGETIDYGPCAFMDEYHPNTVFSSIDTQGRYAFSNQANMAYWNLARFAETLLSQLHEDEKEAIQIAEDILKTFEKTYVSLWTKGMKNKLGLFNDHPDDLKLINDLLSLMKKHKLDFTNTFIEIERGKVKSVLLDWFSRYLKRVTGQNLTLLQIKKKMKRYNPRVIPRNHLVDQAIKAIKNNDKEPLILLIDSIQNPFRDEHPDHFSKLPSDQERVLKTFCGT